MNYGRSTKNALAAIGNASALIACAAGLAALRRPAEHAGGFVPADRDTRSVVRAPLSEGAVALEGPTVVCPKPGGAGGRLSAA